ncbi:MAG: lipopolysaccharide assembly protein LapA domain-containing protein [Myxococcota bacterium]|nr:lipopolysaccharide assembly protein LapA domain-containing protein [Myxococcota bacterium]
MKWLKRGIVFLVLLAIWFIGWHFVDAHALPVRLDFGSERFIEIPLWQALLAAAGFGAATVGIPLCFVLIRSKLEGRHYRKQGRRLEDELHGLRNLPLEQQTQKDPDEGSI